MILGRISGLWERLARSNPIEVTNAPSMVWTRHVICSGWIYGMELWKARNALIHGSDGPISFFELQRTQRLVQAMYSRLLPAVQGKRSEIAPLSEAEMLQQSHQSQCAWLEQLKYLYPDQFGNLVTQTVGKLQSDREEETLLLRKTGQAFTSL